MLNFKWLTKSPFWLVFLVCVIIAATAIYSISRSVLIQMDTLRTAASDTNVWTLAQLEVEATRLELAITDLEATTDPDNAQRRALKHMKQRFDIYYSRVETVRQSQEFRRYDEIPALKSGMETIHAFIIEATALVDGPSSELISNLASLRQEVQTQRLVIRDLNLGLIREISIDRDAKRLELRRLILILSLVWVITALGLLGTIATIISVYNRHRLKTAELRLVYGRLEATIEGSLDGIILADKNDRVIEYSKSAQAIFGYDRQQALGRTLSSFLVEPQLVRTYESERARYLAQSAIAPETTELIRLEASRIDGDQFPAELSVVAVELSGEPHYVTYIRDISDRVSKETELREARDKALEGEQTKTEFLALMSHEMRNPLNSLVGALDLLGSSDLNTEQNKIVDISKHSSRLLLTHLNAILDISKLSSSSVDLDDSVFDLDAQVEQLVADNRPWANDNGNSLILHKPSADIGLVHGDQLRLAQIILNLLSNAIKFTEDGVVSLEYEPLKRTGKRIELEFRVSDTGIGISNDKLEKIFDEFVTLDTAFNRKTGGTGLGLAIVKRILTAMNGKFGVESIPGEGSLFWFRITIATVSGVETGLVRGNQHGQLKLEPTKTGEAKPDTPLFTDLKALTVDDSQLNREITKALLQERGLDVETASSGSAALELCERNKYDLIFMDISMPGMDGIEATSRLRAMGGHYAVCPILGLTAHALPHQLKAFSQAGLNDVIIKPLRTEELTKVLDRWLDKPQSDNTLDLFIEPVPAPAPKKSNLIAADLIEDLARLLSKEQLQTRIGQMDEELKGKEAEFNLAIDLDLTLEKQAELAKQFHNCAGLAATFGLTELHARYKDLQTFGEQAELEDLFDLSLCEDLSQLRGDSIQEINALLAGLP